MIQRWGFLFFLVFVIAVPFAIPQEGGEAGQGFPPEAIFVAAYRGDAEILREILATKPDKNVRDAFGDTALHVAIFQKDVSVVKLLLDYGFDPNAKTVRNGYTPLHNAVAANNIEAARLLLRYGANKNIKALDGLTPIDKARKEEKQAFVMLLYR